MSKTKSQWELDYFKRQERVNSYARSRYKPRLRPAQKLLVYHPDEHRRYLQHHPCEGCKANSFCDEPCEVYLQWYNARMEAAGKRMRQEAFQIP